MPTHSTLTGTQLAALEGQPTIITLLEATLRILRTWYHTRYMAILLMFKVVVGGVTLQEDGVVAGGVVLLGQWDLDQMEKLKMEE